MTVARIAFETFRGLVEWVITPIPGPMGYALRWLYYRAILGSLGSGTLIDTGVRIENPRSVFIGRRCWIDRNVLILGAVVDPLRGRPGKWVRRDSATEGRVVIGDEVHLAPNVVLSGLAGLRIGSKLTVAAGSKVYSLSHHDHNPETGQPAVFGSRGVDDEQYLIAGPVVLGDRSGVGLQSIVLPGAELAAGAFLCAASVLKGPTEAGLVYAGNPARAQRGRGTS